MPAYFSLTFELNKSHNAMKDFYENLIYAGLVFQSGYCGFENERFEDIITWNQNKLDENFELGYTEHHSHDYRQMLFHYVDFSEVRVFVMNDRTERTFSFDVIIPESDLLNYTKDNEGRYSVQRNFERMERLKSVAKKMWVNSSVLAIQTGWECSDIPPSAEDIARGIQPQTEPFCIIQAVSVVKDQDHIYEYIQRNGVLIEEA